MICYDKFQIQDRYYLWEGSEGYNWGRYTGASTVSAVLFLKLSDIHIYIYIYWSVLFMCFLCT